MQATLDVEELIFIGACAIYGGMVGAGKEGACAREKAIKESKKIWNDSDIPSPVGSARHDFYAAATPPRR